MVDVPGISNSQEIREFSKEAQGRSNADLYKDYSSGLGSARGLMQDSGSFDAGLGTKNPTLSAIQSRYGQKYDQFEKGLKLDLMRKADEDNIKKLTIANQLADREMALNREREILKNKIKSAKKAARGATIGNILGIAGGAVGAYYGGGAAGGMAGMGIGQGVGSAIGGGAF